jgi:hypothetical protein
MCTLLHPSMKHFQIAPNEKHKAIKLVKQELLKRTPASAIVVSDLNASTTAVSMAFNTTASITSSDLLTRCFDQPQLAVKPIVTPINELDNYMILDISVHEINDVLLFWKENDKSFPMLASIVRDLFAISASNTSIERLFSASKNNVTDRRTRLAAEKVNKLLFLQKNLRSLDRINKEKLIKSQEQFKRSLSTSDDEQISVIKNKDNFNSTTTTKKTKTNDDYDYSSDDTENMIDSTT